MDAVRIEAPAKVNLDLIVHGRRPDGFHELTTTMVLVGVRDVLELGRARSAGVTCEVDGPCATEDVPTDARNLAVASLERGLAVLTATGPAPQGVHLRLTKNVPAGAGLGGGSSDAAAALLGLERLAGRELGPVVRASILADLGSDTVFFDAAGRTGAGLCTGRGERVRSAPSPSGWWAALLTPAVVVPTGPVFAALGAAHWTPGTPTTFGRCRRPRRWRCCGKSGPRWPTTPGNSRRLACGPAPRRSTAPRDSTASSAPLPPVALLVSLPPQCTVT